MSDTQAAVSLRGFRAGRAARVLLILSFVLLVASLSSNLVQLSIITRARSGQVTTEEASISDSRQQVIGVLQLLMLVATGTVFFVWFYSAHKNLSRMGLVNTAYRSSWAVWGFFVPFVNFVRPAQVMKEVWNESNPARFLSPEGKLEASKNRMPAVVGWWWALFFVSNVLGNVAGRMALKADSTLDELSTLTILMLASDILEAASSVLAVYIVSRILFWQSAFHPQSPSAQTQEAVAPQMATDKPDVGS